MWRSFQDCECFNNGTLLLFSLVQLGVALRAVWRSNNFAYHKIAAAPHHRAVCSVVL
jgi:hypothetical protein